MEYNLVIEDNVDVCVDPHTPLNVSFQPRNKVTLPIGSELLIRHMTLDQLQKFIVADIKFFHKKSIEGKKVAVFYNNHPLRKGDILQNLIHIDALPKET
jgi:hypothetical protein